VPTTRPAEQAEPPARADPPDRRDDQHDQDQDNDDSSGPGPGGDDSGGGHQASRTIAGRSFAQVVWDFFAAHPLPG